MFEKVPPLSPLVLLRNVKGNVRLIVIFGSLGSAFVIKNDFGRLPVDLFKFYIVTLSFY